MIVFSTKGRRDMPNMYVASSPFTCSASTDAVHLFQALRRRPRRRHFHAPLGPSHPPAHPLLPAHGLHARRQTSDGARCESGAYPEVVRGLHYERCARDGEHGTSGDRGSDGSEGPGVLAAVSMSPPTSGSEIDKGEADSERFVYVTELNSHRTQSVRPTLSRLALSSSVRLH